MFIVMSRVFLSYDIQAESQSMCLVMSVCVELFAKHVRCIQFSFSVRCLITPTLASLKENFVNFFLPGIPLPLYGALAYGFVAFLGLQLSGKKAVFGLGETDARFALLGSTTTMATASAYFLYLLSTKFAGTSCPYCLFSAALSFSLFFISVKVQSPVC